MTQIDEIKQKIDIVDLISGYLELKKAGRNFRGLCPFHGEKTPSFMVSKELQIFKCFGCGETGDILTFYQKIEGVEFPNALESLAERAGVKLEKARTDPDAAKKKKLYQINELSAQYYSYILTEHKVGEKALKYLKEKRKLKPQTISDFRLGYAPDSWDSLVKFLNKKGFSNEEILDAGVVVPGKRGGPIDKFRGRVIFPLTGIDGKIVGFTARALGDEQPKYLNSPETLIFHKSSLIYGLDKARVSLKSNGAVLVEGQVDVISAHQAKIDNVVATSGTALTLAQLKILARYTKDLTFTYDSDSAGDRAILRAIELAEKEGFNVKVGIIPEKFKDLDEVIAQSPESAKDLLANAVPAYDYFLVSALKRNNKENPIGKKKIMQELVDVFGNLSDPVLKDHYIKKIAQEVSVNEAVVADLLKTKNLENLEKSYKPAESLNYSKKTQEEYILALLLKAPLDMAQTTLYKLAQRDFTDNSLSEIFVELKKHLLGRQRKLDVAAFVKRFDDTQKEIINNLYLWDIEDLVDNEKQLDKEIDRIFEQIKKATAKRELKILSERIKLAEMEGNKQELTDLTKEFQELSAKLL